MKTRILIIEDDCDFAESLELALSLRDMEIDTAHCGEDGLHKYSTGNYDIAITDIRLPDVSGLEVLRRILSLDDQARVMVMTGYREQELIEQARQGGAAEVFLKPFRIKEVLDRVEHCIN